MFKHILIPTDGSSVSARAAKAGIALARKHKARVTGYHAIEPMTQIYAEGYFPDSATLQEVDRRSRAAAQRYLAAIAQAAKKAGVPFASVTQTTSRPDEGIMQVAKKRKCDLIFMASHGRSGLQRLVVGSVTDRVIHRSKVPVLVYR